MEVHHDPSLKSFSHHSGQPFQCRAFAHLLKEKAIFFLSKRGNFLYSNKKYLIPD